MNSEQLRNNLIDALTRKAVIKTSAVAAALRSIPRDHFTPWLSLQEAYADRAVINPATSEANISTVSQPTAVAHFLEAFNLKPGQRVLEIGAGSGYQAALIAHIIGASGHVTTVDIAELLVVKAKQNLQRLGISNVEVVLGDGALGYLPAAPYDRIVATVGLRELPKLWTQQLEPGGKIVFPLHVGGEPQQHVLVSLQREGGRFAGPGLAALDMVLLRGPGVSQEETVKRGAAWSGGYAHELWVQIGFDEVGPSPKQKFIRRGETTILVEVRPA